MTKKTYIALVRIKHDGEDFEIGETLELDDKKDAPALLDVQAIELAAAEEKAQPPAKTAKK